MKAVVDRKEAVTFRVLAVLTCVLYSVLNGDITAAITLCLLAVLTCVSDYVISKAVVDLKAVPTLCLSLWLLVS